MNAIWLERCAKLHNEKSKMWGAKAIRFIIARDELAARDAAKFAASYYQDSRKITEILNRH